MGLAQVQQTQGHAPGAARFTIERSSFRPPFGLPTGSRRDSSHALRFEALAMHNLDRRCPARCRRSSRCVGEATPQGVTRGLHADRPAMFRDCALDRPAPVAAGLQRVPDMRAPTCGLVVVAGLVLGGAAARAAPVHSASRHKKTKRPAEAAPVDSAGRHKKPRRPAEAAPAPPADDGADADRRTAATTETTTVAMTEAKPVALDTRDATGDIIDDKDGSKDAAKLVKAAPARSGRGWQVAIGPYLWASSVDADVSLGGTASAGVDIGFIPLERHARYGVELLAEVRHGRFALYGDLMYGAAQVTGSTSIASEMVTLEGNASSLLLDGAAGYQVIGDAEALVSLEARAGVRYQRTEINGEVGVAGITVQLPGSIDAGSDVLVGARGVLRPARWLFFSGVADYGVLGASDRTWSASADASLRVSSHVLISVGWRTLTMERAHVSLALHGPRAAVQLIF
ncbi:MAG TPA: hypothetical protein VFT22_30695 [Kofleriaceae bacterium]|nr:hypothetical protein [Kofleriaceae bacterium]